NIIYVVTNRCDQSGKGPTPACDRRIFRTRDGADNWSEATVTPLTGGLGEALVIDPRDNDTLYLYVNGSGGEDGVSKSVDGGRTWSTPTVFTYGPYPFFTSSFALAIDPRNPSTIYACGASPLVFKSTDEGQSWTIIYLGFADAIVLDSRTPG